MLSLTFFYSNSDPTIEDTRSQTQEHCNKNDLLFVDICIDGNAELHDKYQGRTPVICVGPYTLYSPYKKTDLEIATRTALIRRQQLSDEQDQRYQQRIRNGVSISRLDRFSFFFSKYYVWIISAFLSLFIAIPFLAPILMKTEHEGGAKAIYGFYHILCHQFAFRSFFLFGEQAYYPRTEAGIPGLITYEQISGSTFIDIDLAREFVGNEQIGYKVAICERDIAIYGSMALFGFLFQFTHKKIKMIPWLLWIFISVLPVAIDGFSQIPSLSTEWPAWVPLRESTPILRLVTGTLFGLGTAWFMFPMIEENLRETRITLTRKFAIIKKLQSNPIKVSDDPKE